MARIYLSARWERQQELRAVRNALLGYGYEVPCRWLDETVDVATNQDRAMAARHCIEDITECGEFVAFTESARRTERGGRFAELGIALEQGCRVILCGPREENIFHHLSTLEQVDSVVQLLARLRNKRA
jgi:hypothetical protein